MRIPRRAAASLAAAGATTASFFAFAPDARRHRLCPTIELNTGTCIPQLGFGTYLTNGDELYAALVHAIRVGYRHIDTAAGYQNEPTVADAIDDAGVPRSELFITSKLWCSDHGRKRTQRAIARSLRDLRTDHLDLYLIHAPDNQGSTAEEIKRLRLESWQVLEEAHRAGVLKAIGASNFEPRHIDQLLVGRADAVVPAVNQIELHPLLEQSEVIDYCTRKGIVIEAYGSVGGGAPQEPLVKQVAQKYGRSPALISLRHTLQRGTRARGGSGALDPAEADAEPPPKGLVLLAKSLRNERIDENLRVFDFEIDDEDAMALDRLATRDGRDYWDNSDVP